MPEPRYEPPRPSEPMVSRATLHTSKSVAKVAVPVKHAPPARAAAPAKAAAKSVKPHKPTKAPAKPAKTAAKKPAAKKR